MTTFESKTTKAECNETEIFSLLSDLNNIEKIKDKIPQDKVKNLEFDGDSCRFTVDPVGKIGLKIVERDPSKTIKFAADQSPVGFNLWIQLKQVEENDTRIKITVKADLNPMLKMIASKPMETFVNKLAEMLAQLPYRQMT
jgi:carbon monoxide dehydrogenase subunit G